MEWRPDFLGRDTHELDAQACTLASCNAVPYLLNQKKKNAARDSSAQMQFGDSDLGTGSCNKFWSVAPPSNCPLHMHLNLHSCCVHSRLQVHKRTLVTTKTISHRGTSHFTLEQYSVGCRSLIMVMLQDKKCLSIS